MESGTFIIDTELSVCAEENLLLHNQGSNFVFSVAYQIDGPGGAWVPACGGCKRHLLEEDIDDLYPYMNH